jgi:hypothetical protein
MSTINKIKCRRCNGKGKVELDPILSGTLHILRELKSCTALQMFECLERQQNLSINVTALNKRLERLRAAGLARREKKGKTWQYSPS